jgi:hypothetical protein
VATQFGAFPLIRSGVLSISRGFGHGSASITHLFAKKDEGAAENGAHICLDLAVSDGVAEHFGQRSAPRFRRRVCRHSTNSRNSSSFSRSLIPVVVARWAGCDARGRCGFPDWRGLLASAGVAGLRLVAAPGAAFVRNGCSPCCCWPGQAQVSHSGQFRGAASALIVAAMTVAAAITRTRVIWLLASFRRPWHTFVQGTHCDSVRGAS